MKYLPEKRLLQKLTNRTKLKNNFQLEKGFTLIELLLVMMTMALLFGLGYANYRGFQRRQQLEGAVRMVKGDLRLAQQFALAGRKEPGCDGLKGYAFQRGVSEINYRIEDDCNSGGGNVIKSQNLPSGITIPGFGGGNRILFKVLGRGIDRTSNVTIILNQANTGNSRNIIVTTSGEIR